MDAEIGCGIYCHVEYLKVYENEKQNLSSPTETKADAVVKNVKSEIETLVAHYEITGNPTNIVYRGLIKDLIQKTLRTPHNKMKEVWRSSLDLKKS